MVENKDGYKSLIQREILLKLIENDEIEKNFFLTGGTALSVFYLSHRKSEDLDLFTKEEINLNGISSWIKLNFSNYASILNISPNYLSYNVSSIKIDFVIDITSIDCKRETFKFENGKSLKIDCIENIASNKLCAIISRIEIRDLVDFYFIMNEFKIDFKEIYMISRNKETLFDDPPSIAYEIEQRIEFFKNLKFIPLNMIKEISLDEMFEFYKNLAKETYEISD